MFGFKMTFLFFCHIRSVCFSFVFVLYDMRFTLELKNKEKVPTFYFSGVVPICHDLRQQARSTIANSHLTCLLNCSVTKWPFQNVSNIAVTVMKRSYIKCFAFTYSFRLLWLLHSTTTTSELTWFSLLSFEILFKKRHFYLNWCFKILYTGGFCPVYCLFFYSKTLEHISQKTWMSKLIINMSNYICKQNTHLNVSSFVKGLSIIFIVV